MSMDSAAVSSAVSSSATEGWLALVIGNTRLHWGYFEGDRLLATWHTPHLERDLARRVQSSSFDRDSWQRIPGLVYSEVAGESSRLQKPTSLSPRSLWIASVVPAQTPLWANQRSSDGEKTHQVPAFVVERSRIPLQNIYPTLGVDRAINLLGAGYSLGWPVLVIDAGTALTFTAGENNAVLGGAILPGMRLQARMLAQKTADLPLVEDWLLVKQPALPERWAATTDGAIASGLTYGVLSTLRDYLASWWQQFPTGNAVLTGGDGPALHALLQQKTPEIASRVHIDSNLMFAGIQRYRKGAMLLL